MNKNLLLASGAAVVFLVTGCASGPKHEAPAPAPTPKSYVIKGVNFEFDSSKLTPAGESIVAEAAAGIKAASGHTFNVVGHTDSVGSLQYNQGLSERRANTVTNSLIAKLIAEEVGYTSPNLAAIALLPEKVRNNRTAYPSAEDLAKGEFQVDVGEALSIYEKYWQRLKAGK